MSSTYSLFLFFQRTAAQPTLEVRRWNLGTGTVPSGIYTLYCERNTTYSWIQPQLQNIQLEKKTILQKPSKHLQLRRGCIFLKHVDIVGNHTDVFSFMDSALPWEGWIPVSTEQSPSLNSSFYSPAPVPPLASQGFFQEKQDRGVILKNLAVMLSCLQRSTFLILICM